LQLFLLHSVDELDIIIENESVPKIIQIWILLFCCKNFQERNFSNSSSRCFAIALFTLASVGFGTAPIALDDAVENVRFSLAWIIPIPDNSHLYRSAMCSSYVWDTTEGEL
jgi:hypothetical protein